MDIVFDFINRKKLFPVHSSLQFCVLSLSTPKLLENKILMSFNQIDPFNLQKSLDYYLEGEEVIKSHSSIFNNILMLKKSDFKLFNPNSRTTPFFSTNHDFLLVKRIYERNVILLLKRENTILKNPWNIEIKRFFHPSGDSDLFYTKEQLIEIRAEEYYDESDHLIKWQDKKNSKIFLPLYTGSAIWLYDHRFNNISPKLDKSKKLKADIVKVSDFDKSDLKFCHKPMYWIEESIGIKKFPDIWKKSWLIGYRKISNATNQRSFIVSVFPKVPNIDSIQNVYFEVFRKEIICLLANLSSIPFDFVVRNKISGVAIPQHMVEQFPVFPPKTYSKNLYEQIKIRVLKLVYNAWIFKQFAEDFNHFEKVDPYIWNSIERLKIQTELDAIFSLMYGLDKNETEYILNSFNALRNLEIRNFGEFKTKRLVLEAYDKFHSDPELGPLFQLEGVDLEKLKGDSKK